MRGRCKNSCQGWLSTITHIRLRPWALAVLTTRGISMRNFSRVLPVAVGVMLACPAVTVAQTADATLRGTAPANATVIARNVATGITRRTQATADGSYTLAGLPPGTYRVEAGAGTETLVTLSVA